MLTPSTISKDHHHVRNANLVAAEVTELFPTRLTLSELRTIQKALKIIETKRLTSAPVLYYYEHFQQYLILRFAGLTNEQMHVLYLDIDSRLLSADVEACGHQSEVITNVRKIALRAIALGAEYIVFAHNHPCDNTIPSAEDVNHLSVAEHTFGALNIKVLDSFVVTSKSITSISDHRERRRKAEEQRRMEEWKNREAERKAKREARRAAKKAAENANLMNVT